MNSPLLHPDDFSPSHPTSLDHQLHRQLCQSVSRHFYEACNGVMQALLLSCQWHVATSTEALLLVVKCPNPATHHRVLNHIAPLSQQFAEFGSTARICVYPPNAEGQPLEILVRDHLR